MVKEKRLKEEFELEELRHKNRMEEITSETTGKKTIESLKFDNQMSLHRIKRADINRTQMRKEFDYGNKSH